MTYQLLLTTLGQDKIAAAANAGSPSFGINEFVVGQGVDVDFSQRLDKQVLVSKRYQGSVESVSSTAIAGQYEVTCIVPIDQGGWTIREFGLIDNDGDLIWVGQLPNVEKPAANSTAAVDYRIKAVIDIDNPDVTLVVDGNVFIASKDWVSNNFVTNTRFAAFLETAYPYGYKHWSHTQDDPTPTFDVLFGYKTYWRRLEGVQLVSVKDGSPIIGDSGMVAGNAQLVATPNDKPKSHTHYTSYLWERYDPDAPIRHNGISRRNGIHKFK